MHTDRQPLWPGSPVLVDVVDRLVFTVREDEVFVFGSETRRGRWAVYGVGRGHRVGTAGQSYAIETIERPGRQYRRGTPLRTIYAQLRELVAFANQRLELDTARHPLP
jgi:hypothetical protein